MRFPIADALVAAAFFGGLALIAVGAGLAYRPAGFVVAGVALVACAALYARGGPAGTRRP